MYVLECVHSEELLVLRETRIYFRPLHTVASARACQKGLKRRLTKPVGTRRGAQVLKALEEDHDNGEDDEAQ